jgi:hypothetical protein
MQDKYTKYIVQSKINSSTCDTWEFWSSFDTLEEAEEVIKFTREAHEKTHVFRMIKRDYETIDILLNE